MVRQVEDEIGVVNMAIGAAHAGVRSMCATSGGGFALMSEGLGMSAMMETPVVVIDCQRAGPSTGVPTKTEQGDLWQMLGAAFGDYPRVLAAPLDIGDCFKIIPEMRWDHIDHFITGARAVSVWMVTGKSADGEKIDGRHHVEEQMRLTGAARPALRHRSRRRKVLRAAANSGLHARISHGEPRLSADGPQLCDRQ